MKIIRFLIFILTLSSCTSKVIYYEYNGTVLSRIDDNGEVKLYYGDIKDKKTKHLYVKATYSGFNSGADAYVFFKEDKTVEIVGASGFFTQSDPSNKLIQLRRYENPVLDSIRNVYQQQGLLLIIDAGLDTEKRRNLENGSKIKATYP